MTYLAILARGAQIVAGDLPAADRLLQDVSTLLDTEALSTDERRRLYKFRSKWAKRARGEDYRWNAVGVKAGRPSTVQKQATARARGEAVDDPLVLSLTRKYGKPIGDDA